jgi:phosphoglycerate kinase
VILGGAKISDKIGVLDRLLEQADYLLVGGGMSNTFLKARGEEVAESLVEDESLDAARRLLDRGGDKLVLPLDVVVAEEFDADAQRKSVGTDEVLAGWRILDVGPKTIERFRQTLREARTVVWNGPLGAFELEPFSEGTKAIAKALADLDATTIVGGGETVTAVAQTGVADRLTHVSTGGGAFLEFMEGKDLPGVSVLQDPSK